MARGCATWTDAWVAEDAAAENLGRWQGKCGGWHVCWPPRFTPWKKGTWYHVINRWNLGLMLLILSIFEANHLPQTPWRTSCFFCRVSIFGSWKKEPTWAASAWLRSEFEPWSQFYSFAVFTIFYLRTMSNTAHHVFILSRECKPRIP